MLENNFKIKINCMEAKSYFWQVSGVVYLLDIISNVDETCEILKKEIPSACSKFSCPSCHRLQYLYYNVEKLNLVNGCYNFTMRIECVKCKKRYSFKEAIGRALKYIHLDFGSGGISFRDNS